jgi:hypothetical protein
LQSTACLSEGVLPGVGVEQDLGSPHQRIW